MKLLKYPVKPKKGNFMRSIALIPARGGSKRLPHKNVKDFMGKPMLIWSCEAAKNSGCFEKILVSTEDVEIAKIVLDYGFDVDRRPLELATDTASAAEVCLDLLQRECAKGRNYDALCCLYATAPLRGAEDIQSVMHLLEEEDTEAAFAMCKYIHSPYQAMIPDARGFYRPIQPLVVKLKSQQLPTPLIGNGSTYAVKVKPFQKTQHFYGMDTKSYLMPSMRSVDIDTAEQFEIALCFAQYLQSRGLWHFN